MSNALSLSPRCPHAAQVEGSDFSGRVEYGFDFYQTPASSNEPSDPVVAGVGGGRGGGQQVSCA